MLRWQEILRGGSAGSKTTDSWSLPKTQVGKKINHAETGPDSDRCLTSAWWRTLLFLWVMRRRRRRRGEWKGEDRRGELEPSWTISKRKSCRGGGVRTVMNHRIRESAGKNSKGWGAGYVNEQILGKSGGNRRRSAFHKAERGKEMKIKEKMREGSSEQGWRTFLPTPDVKLSLDVATVTLTAL